MLNQDKFICKPKIFYRKLKPLNEEYLYLRYENIINNIVVLVTEHGSIDMRIENLVGLECVDLLADFLVALSINNEGKYFNNSYLEQYIQYYDSPDKVYYDEFNSFLEWSNAMISEDHFLYVHNCYGRH